MLPATVPLFFDQATVNVEPCAIHLSKSMVKGVEVLETAELEPLNALPAASMAPVALDAPLAPPVALEPYPVEAESVP